MKLIFFVGLAIAILPADSWDFPGNHVNQTESDSLEERKGEMEMELRGNAGKKNIKTLMKRLGSMDKRITQQNSDMKIETQAIKKNLGNIADINTELKNITTSLDTLNDDNAKLNKSNSEMKIESQAIKKSLDVLKDSNTKLTQADSQIKVENQAIKKSLDVLKDSNTKLTQADSQIKAENQAIKKSLDLLKDSNTKLTQADSKMNIENQALKRSLDLLKDGNTKLTQANSEMKIQLQAIQKRQGGALIGGQYLTFSTDKMSWTDAVSKCSSLNGRLAVLDNPQAFHNYVNSKYRGQHFWLGGSDRSKEGTWTWIDGKSLGNSFPWTSGQPSDSSNEDCLGWGYNYGYNDYQCPRDWLRYVCEHGDF